MIATAGSPAGQNPAYRPSDPFSFLFEVPSGRGWDEMTPRHNHALMLNASSMYVLLMVNHTVVVSTSILS
jgi:hypothetical protein